MLTKSLLALTIAGLVIAGIAIAQQPRMPSPMAFPWWDSPLANDLNLTDIQTKQIRAAVSEYRGRLADLRASVNRAEGALEAVFNEDTVDQRKANEAIDQLVGARGELFRTTSQLDLKLRTLLTAEQWQGLQNRQRGRGGPGSGKRRRGPGPDPISKSAPSSPPPSQPAKVAPAVSASQK